MALIKIKGKKTNLIEVSELDAELIIALRNNPDINKYLSSSKPISLTEQQAWIRNNAEKKDNIYFKITDSSEQFKGTVSLYNIKGNEGEFGRFICINSLNAIEAEYMTLKYAFEERKMKKLYSKSIEENKKAWNMHFRFGFKNVSTEYHEQLRKNQIVQAITIDDYKQTDYQPLLSLIDKF
jgi:UDP-4-amino-4,6-dideoxy-N-acetyl-beta-L-altrosamine N-acetyltransferase